eukprot:237309_1
MKVQVHNRENVQFGKTSKNQQYGYHAGGVVQQPAYPTGGHPGYPAMASQSVHFQTESTKSPRTETGSWACDQCTFFNEANMEECEVCANPRFPDKADASNSSNVMSLPNGGSIEIDSALIGLSNQKSKDELKKVWEDDKTRTRCPFCEKDFKVTRRRHHCRQCGIVACDGCSANRKYLSDYDELVRVCDPCFMLDSEENPKESSPTAPSVESHPEPYAFHPVPRDQLNQQPVHQQPAHQQHAYPQRPMTYQAPAAYQPQTHHPEPAHHQPAPVHHQAPPVHQQHAQVH